MYVYVHVCCVPDWIQTGYYTIINMYMYVIKLHVVCSTIEFTVCMCNVHVHMETTCTVKKDCYKPTYNLIIPLL